LDAANLRQISWMPVPGLRASAHVLGTFLSGLQIDASSDVSISYIGSGSGAKAIFGLIGLYGIFFFGVGAYRALKALSSIERDFNISGVTRCNGILVMILQKR
jgi:hypothetical protein